MIILQIFSKYYINHISRSIRPSRLAIWNINLCHVIMTSFIAHFASAHKAHGTKVKTWPSNAVYNQFIFFFFRIVIKLLQSLILSLFYHAIPWDCAHLAAVFAYEIECVGAEAYSIHRNGVCSVVLPAVHFSGE